MGVAFNEEYITLYETIRVVAQHPKLSQLYKGNLRLAEKGIAHV